VLVFTRKRNETIMIGDGIEIRVLRIGREGVRLGVTAPPSVPVHRREVYDLIRDENRRAAGAAPSIVRLRDRLRRSAELAVPAKEPHAT
jgi:carbon storage regulator